MIKKPHVAGWRAYFTPEGEELLLKAAVSV
jgi:hypothetical protein